MYDPFNNISNELWLMLACASGDTTKIMTILRQNVNWDIFLKLTTHHRIYPLVYKTINQLNNPVIPEYVVSHLRQKYQVNIIRTISMAGETIKLIKTFESHGISSLVLKGAPLAWYLYGDITSRMSNDIDIIVAPDELKKAQEILENEGYRRILPAYDMTDRQLQILNRTINLREFVYRHNKKNIILELEGALGYELTMPADIDIKKIEVSGKSIPALSDENWLLFLMLHGAKHAWFRLRWLVDIAKFIRVRNIDWDKIDLMIENSNMRSFFYQGLILANRLLAVPVPPIFKSGLEHNQTVWRLACRAMKVCLATNYTYSQYLLSIYKFQLQPGLKNKLKYVMQFFSPTQEDIKLITLPNRLYPLYYIIRPFTWVGRVSVHKIM